MYEKIKLVKNEPKLCIYKMFEQILELESDTIWVYGKSSSVAYPLAKIDTINQVCSYMYIILNTMAKTWFYRILET